MTLYLRQRRAGGREGNMGKLQGRALIRRAAAAGVLWLGCLGTLVALPAFGQQSAGQLDDLTGTMTRYVPPKAGAPARAGTAANAPALQQRKRPAQSHAPSTTRADTTHRALQERRASPAPVPPPSPTMTPAPIAAAPAVTAPAAPAPIAPGTTTPVRPDGEAGFWTRPWTWVAAPVLLALLMLEVAGWRRHHRRKRDAAVLASLVPDVRTGDREADYHPRPVQPSDKPRQFGAG
jgi:hypothetical protein